jgi:hypothetical protein
MAILIPEIIIKNTFDSLFKYVWDDYNSQSDEKDSIIYGMLYGLELDNFDYYKETLKLLENRFGKSSRRMNLSLGYDLNSKNYPKISIILPNEESALNLANMTTDYEYNEAETKGWQVNVNGYRTTYNLLITSDNPNEVVLIYHFLKALATSSPEQFELNGLINVIISGRDITLDMEVPPPNYLFHRTVALSFEYNNSVRVLTSDIEHDVNGVEGTPTDEL